MMRLDAEQDQDEPNGCIRKRLLTIPRSSYHCLLARKLRVTLESDLVQSKEATAKIESHLLTSFSSSIPIEPGRITLSIDRFALATCPTHGWTQNGWSPSNLKTLTPAQERMDQGRLYLEVQRDRKRTLGRGRSVRLAGIADEGVDNAERRLCGLIVEERDVGHRNEADLEAAWTRARQLRVPGNRK